MKLADQEVIVSWAKELLLRRARDLTSQFKDANEVDLRIKRQRRYFVDTLRAMDVDESYTKQVMEMKL